MIARILLVEDDRLWVNLLTTALNKQGCELDVVDNVVKAMFRVANYDYDLVIMDYMLPMFDGKCIEPLLLKMNVPALYFTGTPKLDIETTFPVIQKGEKLKNLTEKIDEMIKTNFCTKTTRLKIRPKEDTAEMPACGTEGCALAL